NAILSLKLYVIRCITPAERDQQVVRRGISHTEQDDATSIEAIEGVVPCRQIRIEAVGNQKQPRSTIHHACSRKVDDLPTHECARTSSYRFRRSRLEVLFS